MHGILTPFICTDGARVRDALHTVLMGSGASAYERLIWQLGFTIVEVPPQVCTLQWTMDLSGRCFTRCTII